MSGGGGGADLDVITAGAEDVLASKVIVDKDGEPLVGTMKNQGDWGFQELTAGSAVAIPEGKHGGGGKVTAKSLASQTPGDSAAGHILAGRTAWVNGSKITGTIPSQAGGTLTPSTSTVTANCSGKYMTSNYTIPAFALPPANALRKGYSYTLYGKTVTGTFEGYVTSPYTFLKGGSSSPVDNTGGATAIKKFYGFNTVATKMTSGAQINGYGIIVSNNEYGIVGTASIRFNNAVNLSAYKILDVSDLTGTYFICFEVSGNVNVVSSSRSCIAHKTEAILSNS